MLAETETEFPLQSLRSRNGKKKHNSHLPQTKYHSVN